MLGVRVSHLWRTMGYFAGLTTLRAASEAFQHNRAQLSGLLNCVAFVQGHRGVSVSTYSAVLSGCVCCRKIHGKKRRWHSTLPVP